MALVNLTKEVPAEGSKDAKICIVGEAPGSWEEREGRPFCGPAGGILEQCLHAAGILRTECYITNVFKFRVKKKIRAGKSDIYHPNGELLWHADKGFSVYAQQFLNQFYEELKNVRSNVIVPMGNTALESVSKRKFITRQRGSILRADYIGDRKLVPTIHPSATLQSGDYLARYYIIFDLRRAKDEAETPEVEYPRQDFIIQPTFQEVILNVQDYALLGRKGKRINYDVEIINQEISAISLACNINRAISIPFDTRWTEVEEIEIWDELIKIFEDDGIRKCNQNISFDNDAILTRNRILVRGQLDDPMLACNLVYPDFPKGLDFITSVFTRIPYYKDEGKIWFKGMGKDIDDFYRYSCQDSACSIHAMEMLDDELEKGGYRGLYHQTLRLYPIIQAMMYRGIRADKEKINEIKARLEEERDQKQAELDEAVGFHLNVKSTKQKTEYFYLGKGIKPYLKGGSATTDEKAMVKLAKGTATRAPIPEAQLVVDITKIRSMLEKYMEVSLDADGRLRCQINPRGTTTGRLSTGKRLITNSGLNMQNLNEEFKKVLFADEGYILAELDKKQAEWVIVAFASGDARMIEIVSKGIDPHARTGQLITGVSDIDLIKAEAAELSHETNPDVLEMVRQEKFPDLIKHREQGGYLPRNMTIRQCGKKSNHGGNYGMGYRRCAREWEIPEYEAKRILPLYHKAYPGVENGFQDGIIRQLSKDRTITNCFGRKRRFLNRIDWRNRSSKAFEQAFGFLPQSTVADLINEGMILIYADTRPPMDRVEILMQVHDSILVQIPLDSDIAGAISQMCEYLDPELEYGGRKFRIETEIKIGYCWGEMKEVPFESDTGRLAKRISKVLGEF